LFRSKEQLPNELNQPHEDLHEGHHTYADEESKCAT